MQATLQGSMKPVQHFRIHLELLIIYFRHLRESSQIFRDGIEKQTRGQNIILFLKIDDNFFLRLIRIDFFILMYICRKVIKMTHL